MNTKKECCKQELTKKVDGVMTPYRCGRPEFKDGRCKTHHPDLIKARELICDMRNREYEEETEKKHLTNKVISTMGDAKLTESTAIALLVQLGYRVERPGMNPSVQTQPPISSGPSLKEQEQYKDKIDEPISTLNFSVRCTNILKSNKILTIGDLMACSLKYIYGIRYLSIAENELIVATMLSLGAEFSNQ